MAKVHITFKTPDALDDAAKDYAERVRDEANQDNNMSEEDAEELYLEALEKAKKVGSKFISSGEFLSVELDVDAGTCTVVRR